MSMAEHQLVLELQRRIAVLEALVKGDPLVERVQRLEMRCGSLQSQLNLLRNKTPVAPSSEPYEAAQDKANAPAG